MGLEFVREPDLEHAGAAMTSAIFSDGRPMREEEFATYAEHAVATVGQELHLSDPVIATIRPTHLLPPS